MKTTPIRHFFCLFFVLFAVQSLSATDYYWVGGTGDWSNFQYHWATSSGGTTFHPIPPTQNDDVYFDQNSFTGSGQAVTMNTQFSYCQNIDWTGVQNNPTWAGETELNVYGSLTLAQNMLLDFTDFNSIIFKFQATTPGHVVNTYGHTLAHPTGGAWVYFQGQGGEWTLESDLMIGDPGNIANVLVLSYGSLITNDYRIESGEIKIDAIPGNKADLGTSTLVGRNVWIQGPDSTAVDADSTTIYAGDLTIDAPGHYHIARVKGNLTGAFGSRWVHFDDLELSAPNVGTQLVGGNFVHHDRFHIADSGRTLSINGNHLIMDQISIRTRPGFPIRIQGASEFYKASGTLCFEWLYLENSMAYGAANWYAGWQSSDLGGNSGWLFSTNDSCQSLVSVEKPLAHQAQWLPNPVVPNEQLRVEFATETAGEVVLSVWDLQGRQMWREQKSMSSGQHRLAIPTHLLARGSYMGVIETPSGQHRQLLLVQ